MESISTGKQGLKGRRGRCACSRHWPHLGVGCQAHGRVQGTTTRVQTRGVYLYLEFQQGGGDRGASAAGPPPSTAELQLQRLPLVLEMALVSSARGFAFSKGCAGVSLSCRIRCRGFPFRSWCVSVFAPWHHLLPHHHGELPSFTFGCCAVRSVTGVRVEAHTGAPVL